MGSGAKSHMRKSANIFSYMRTPLVMYMNMTRSRLNFLIYKENFILFFICVYLYI